MSGTFRRAVVTGGTGFLGQRLCRGLLDQGTDVVWVVSLLTESPAGISVPAGGPRLEFRLTDMAEPFDVPGEVDLVVHLRSPAAAADYPRYPLETRDRGVEPVMRPREAGPAAFWLLDQAAELAARQR